MGVEALDRPRDRFGGVQRLDLGRDLGRVDDLAADRRRARPPAVAVAVRAAVAVRVHPGIVVEWPRPCDLGLDHWELRTAHQTAHSPSPRSTLYGSERFQSMNWFIDSRLNSAGMVRSLTSSSKRSVPNRSTKSLNASSPSRSAS